MASAVSSTQKCSGFLRSQSVSAAAEYGTTASSSVRDPPGTASSSAIADAPPPVTTIMYCAWGCVEGAAVVRAAKSATTAAHSKMNLSAENRNNWSNTPSASDEGPPQWGPVNLVRDESQQP